MPEHRKKQIYDSIRLEHPDGFLMAIVSQKKANFYLENELATIMDRDPFTIRLNFIPKSLGHAGDEFYLIPRENQCVVCGSRKKLNIHHILPDRYRNLFPKRFKAGNSHDIVSICVECHKTYENPFAIQLTQEIANKFNAPIQGRGLNKQNYYLNKVRGAARSISRHRNIIPTNAIDKLWVFVEHYLQKTRETITQKELVEVCDINIHERSADYKSHAQIVVEQLRTEDEKWQFVEMWRRHFMETMNPQFMPPLWDVSHRRILHEGDGNHE